MIAVGVVPDRRARARAPGYARTLAAQVTDTVQPLTAILLLRAFAAGAVALTGTEAIATGVPAFKPPEAKNAADDPGGDGRPARRAVHRDHVPRRQASRSPNRVPREADGHLAGRRARSTARVDPVLPVPGVHGAAAVPGREHELQRLPAPRSRSWPRTASCPASSRSAATGWPSRTGSSCSASSPRPARHRSSGETHLLIPLYAVGVFIDFTISQTGMIRHWLRERIAGLAAAPVDQRVRRGADRRRGHRRDVGEVPRRRLARARPDPDPRRDDVVHPPPVRRPGDGARRPRRRASLPGPHREQRVVVPVNGINRAVVQAVNFGRTLDAATSGRSTSPTTWTRPRRSARRWARQLPGVPLVIVESPYRAVIAPVVAYLDVLDQAWPPDKEAPDHDRRPARVRRPPLVGPVAVQPDRQAPQGRARRARAHGHRRRPVPARPLTHRPRPTTTGAALIGGRRPLKGRKPADRRVRVERPHAPFFRYTGPGQLVAKPAANVAPHARPAGSSRGSRGVIFGRPLASEEEIGERLSQEEGARDLQLGRDQLVGLRDRGDPAGPRAGRARARCSCRSRSRSRSRSCWRSSRSRTARSAARTRTAAARTSWPRPNLAPIFGLIAAAALLIDYVMTVAVSTAVRARPDPSVVPAAYDVRIEIALRRRSR